MNGNRIVQLRNEIGLTQKELADKLGLTRQALSLYEIGKRDPDTDTLSHIAHFFNVSADYLLGKSNIRKPEEQTYLSSEEKAMLREVGVEYIAIAKEAKDKRISPEDLKKLIELAESLKGKGEK